MSDIERIFCKHEGENGKPFSIINFGDNQQLVLCSKCTMTVRGYVLDDLIKDVSKLVKFTKPFIRSVEE